MSLSFIGLSLFADGYFESKIFNYPRLDAIMLVEKLIKKSKSDLTRPELLMLIRKKIKLTEKAFFLILDYLEKSNKIYIDKKDGKVGWIWNPKGVDELLKKGLVIR